jgi:hypothetical protein
VEKHVAKADPKNTQSIAPIQEVAGALARYVEENSDAPETPTPPANKHLDDLEHTLCTIAKAKGPKLADSELQAQAKAARIKLARRIDYHRSSIARNWRYGRFIDSWKRENAIPDAWLCYIIRLTSLKRKIGQRRGSKSIGNWALARKDAIEQASAVKTRDQLLPVEQRAFDLRKGARRKSDKHPIERRAIQLAKAVENEWFSRRQKGRSEGKWTRKPDAEALSAAEAEETEEMKALRRFDALRPPLTLTDLVSIAREVIEDFAGRKIRRPNKASMALWQVVCGYSKVIAREMPGRNLNISQKAVQEALSRVRRDLKKQRPDLMRIEESASGP